jgi:hypothetical protein
VQHLDPDLLANLPGQLKQQYGFDGLTLELVATGYCQVCWQAAEARRSEHSGYIRSNILAIRAGKGAVYATVFQAHDPACANGDPALVSVPCSQEDPEDRVAPTEWDAHLGHRRRCGGMWSQ